jgi:hypothetical protein
MAKIVALPNGYLLQKQDDNAWWIYRYRESGESNTKLPLKIVSGSGGSIDYEIEKFAEAMRSRPRSISKWRHMADRYRALLGITERG